MSGERPIRVLMTGAGGAGTIEIILSLRRSNRYEIVVADAGRHSYGFHLADRAYVIPFGAAATFSDAMAAILERERPDFVIPLVDEEIPKVHALVDAAFRGQTRVVGPRLEFAELALDKFRMATALAEKGLSTARTVLASEVPQGFPFPAIVKPRAGRGSRGVEVVHDREALAAYLGRASQPASRFVVQERHGGREFTTSVVVGLDGKLLAVVPKEAVDKRGITQVGVTRRVPAVDTLCAAMQQQLRADGPFNVQLMLGPDGVPYVFEVNPRYSTTVALTLAAGIDEVDVVMRHALGESIGPLSYEADLMMLRYSAQLYLPESEWERKYVKLPGA
jgi:carbamoyl-phosphate synthase large subunit